ncbi:MAG: NFACT RNA binding domain-containing protein [Eubacteriales bacterium]
MALDGFVLGSILYELKKKILNGKVNKIYQPETDELVFNIRNKGQNYLLLVSVNNNYPRINLTDNNKKNPYEPYNFCMLLRKYLTSSIIKEIRQINNDRVLEIDFEVFDELRTKSIKTLVVEIMGKHSNVVLLSDNKVLDSIYKIGENKGINRVLYPGVEYKYPDVGNEVNPGTINYNSFKKLFKSENEGKKVYNFFLHNFTGFGPRLSREMCLRSKIDENSKIGEVDENLFDRLYISFENLLKSKKNNNYSWNIYSKDKEYIDFHCFPLDIYKDYTTVNFTSISKLVDEYYYYKDRYQRMQQRIHHLKKIVDKNITKNQSKLLKLKNEYEISKDRDKYKVYGDLIIAYMSTIKNYKDSVKVKNYYDDNNIIEIPLDGRLSLSKNAQKYYKKYEKLKTAQEKINRQIKITKQKLDYFYNLQYMINNCDDFEAVSEIKEELVNRGYLKSKSTKSKKHIKSKPYKVISRDGFEIYIGKNNNQNDYITFNLASKEDIWMHTKNIPGSHVVIITKGREIPDTTLEEAASYAAYHSNARQSSKVPVNYTYKKHIKKPNNAEPGFVIFKKYYTMYINPQKPKENK